MDRRGAEYGELEEVRRLPDLQAGDAVEPLRPAPADLRLGGPEGGFDVSRGLGRVERKVLAWLAASRKHRSRLDLLSEYVSGLRECPRCEEWVPKDVPRSRYVSTARAVQSLERKGYVESEMVCERNPAGEWGDMIRRKVVSLSVDAAESLRRIQHIECDDSHPEGDVAELEGSF